MSTTVRVLLRLEDDRRVPVDPDEVYLLEAEGDRTLVRTRRSLRIEDVRALGQLEALFEPHGFVRVHRSFVLNIGRIRELRPREGEGWEAKMDPPVNRVVPVSEGRVGELWRAFGE